MMLNTQWYFQFPQSSLNPVFKCGIYTIQTVQVVRNVSLSKKKTQELNTFLFLASNPASFPTERQLMLAFKFNGRKMDVLCKSSRLVELDLRWGVHHFRCADSSLIPSTKNTDYFQRLKTGTVHMVSKTIKMLCLLWPCLPVKLQIMALFRPSTNYSSTVSTSKFQHSLLLPLF